MTISVNQSKSLPVGQAQFPEMVERKGKGHPDSVADEVAEACSRTLSKYYQEKFGRYFHHNVDKAAYVGGSALPELGGGQILEPQEFEIIGRAIDKVIIDGKLVMIPVKTLLRETIYDVFKYTFRNMDMEKHVIINSRTKSGSIDLTGVFEQEEAQNTIPLANDTSFGVGFAPFSTTEQMVYDVEMYLNSDKFKDACPGSGEDIKVMGLRDGNDISLTICNAMVSKYLHDKSEYTNAVAQVQEAAMKVCDGLKGDHNVNVSVNTADDLDRDIMFLTITGTSAECGDDGQVGRGNRANGLITPGRVQTLEAAAGKNSMNHVGKLYSLMANRAAKNIVAESEGDILDCQIRIVSQIGAPINKPWMGSCDLIIADGANWENMKRMGDELLQAELDGYLTLRKELYEGKVKVW